MTSEVGVLRQQYTISEDVTIRGRAYRAGWIVELEVGPDLPFAALVPWTPKVRTEAVAVKGKAVGRTAKQVVELDADAARWADRITEKKTREVAELELDIEVTRAGVVKALLKSEAKRLNVFADPPKQTEIPGTESGGDK